MMERGTSTCTCCLFDVLSALKTACVPLDANSCLEQGDLQQLRELNLTLTSTHSTTTADAAIADAGADSTTAVNATTAASGGGSSPSSPSKHDNGGVPIRTSIGSLKIQLQLSEAQLTASRNHSEASLLQLQELKMTLRLRDEQVRQVGFDVRCDD